MALGGAFCGAFLGTPLGAAVGLVVGLCCGHVSWGLDGAVLGILGLAAAGAVAGWLLGVTADERSLRLPDDLGLRPPDRR